MGVVVQSGRITRSSVLKNIVGAASSDEQLAWKAAEGAAIAEEIKAMPMGMQTLIDPTNISGGQAQRILIARALVHRPKIMILDEATSALDNEAQAQITAALKNLKCTRIVIAHRLSTIKSADRIVVIDAGEVAEIGSFEELMRKDGLFASLVQRQTA
jgi:ATP-binding cassette subfamily C protein